jgi:hypothetical protein
MEAGSGRCKICLRRVWAAKTLNKDPYFQCELDHRKPGPRVIALSLASGSMLVKDGNRLSLEIGKRVARSASRD